MTERNPPSWLQAGTHPAEHDRLSTSATWKAEGIVGQNDLAVSAKATPAMSVNVAAGAAIVAGDEDPYQGHYHLVNDATKSVTVTTADGTNPRIDLIVARVYDSAYSGADDEWALECIAGTPSGSPSAPATPDNALVLAQISVAAGATSITSGNITDKRVPAASRVATVSAIGRYPSPGGAGTLVYRDSGDANEGPEFYHGSAWRKPWNMPWGYIASATDNTQTNTTQSPNYATIISVTFTAVANRRYQIDYNTSRVYRLAVGSDVHDVWLRYGTSTDIAQIAYQTLSQGNSLAVSGSAISTFSAGSVTVKAVAATAGADAHTFNMSSSNSYICVTDIGPSGAPS